MLYPVLSWVFGWLRLFLFWLGLIEVGEGEGVKVSVSNLLNYFSVSGDSKQIKNFPQKKWYFDHNWLGWGGGYATLWWAPPKSTTFFLTPPLSLEPNHSYGYSLDIQWILSALYFKEADDIRGSPPWISSCRIYKFRPQASLKPCNIVMQMNLWWSLWV